jgi:hypothetical protein
MGMRNGNGEAVRGDGVVYLAPYDVLTAGDMRRAAPETDATLAFREAVRGGDWPYDPSEDPSSFCARPVRL